MGGFLRPGDLYEIEIGGGVLSCKALSFQQQRELMRLVKKLQANNDPEEAMNIVEKIIDRAAVNWSIDDSFTMDKLLEHVGFAESIEIAKRITGSGKLSEEERKK